MQVAEHWQLGRSGRDDGLLILVVPSAIAARIEVGYGLEGDIPDARASRWLDDLLPAVRNRELAKGLDRLLDQIEGVLPAPEAKKNANPDNYLFPDHPEWRLPFVLAVFSRFALFPLFFGRWGSVASGPLLAAFLGGAAWMLRSSTVAGITVAALALPLPFLWALNWSESGDLATWLRYLEAFGNVITACAALGFYLESRESVHAAGTIQWSKWWFGLALVLALPFALVTLVPSLAGDDPQMRLAQGAAGGGSIAGILWAAARYGVFAAVKIGLGGRFGGGGAGRGD